MARGQVEYAEEDAWDVRGRTGEVLRAAALKSALVIGAAVLLACGTLWLLQGSPARADSGADGALTVEIGTAYNLVVDSNVESPSTYAPSVATVFGRFCNTGTTALTDVWVCIGDYDYDNLTGTPGTYPARTVDASFTSTHPALDNAPGRTYAFTRMGGRAGLNDASRYIGELAPGECRVQYWHFTYPQCEHESDGTPIPRPVMTRLRGATRSSQKTTYGSISSSNPTRPTTTDWRMWGLLA
ncbi:MAG: hypothetical protein PVI07_15740 [Anaerolineae bacterium]